MRSLARLYKYLRGSRALRLRELLGPEVNVSIVARENGKIVDRYEGHNIFLDTGREWLSHQLCLHTIPSYGVYAWPPTSGGDPFYYSPHRLPRYMCFGIGGNKQFYPRTAFNNPPLNLYGAAPAFTQTDTSAVVYALEAPVITSMNGHTVPEQGCKWLGQIGIPSFPGGSPGEFRFTRVFLENELSEAPFDLVPLSEIGLFTDDPSPDYPYTKPTAPGNMIAYDTFNTISKTNAIAIQVDWTFRV